MGLVVLVKKMSILINFLLQNANLVSVLSNICHNFAGSCLTGLTNFVNSVIKSPKQRLETYCFCSVSYYY